MPSRPTSRLQVAALAVAAALGVAMLGSSAWAMVNLQWGLIGLPVAAACASALAYRGRPFVAAVSLAVGVALAAVASTWSVLFAVPAVLAVLAAIVLLRRVSYLAVTAGLIAVFSCVAFALDTMLARRGGKALGDEILAQGKAAASLIASSAQGSGANQLANQVIALYRETIPMLPSMYFFGGTILAVAVIAAIAWSARRADVAVAVPPFDRVDLPPFVVVGAVVGLLAAGFARFASAGSAWATIGSNFITCTGFLLLIQGLAVYSSLFKRIKMRAPGRVAAYVVLLVLDTVTKIVTLTGLADMWLNFRKLPRQGSPDFPLKPVTSSNDDASPGV